MNKAVEQKLIGPMEESHTKEQSPQAVCERCFEQGDQKSQQQGLELVLELVFRVCVRQRKKMGAGISGEGPPWAHEAGARPGGRARPPPSWAGGWLPYCVLSAKYSQIF